MLKRTVVLLVLLFLCPIFAVADEIPQPPDISAQSAALLVAQTGELIFGKDENRRCGMASTTKIMTSLLALEYGCPDMNIVVSERTVNIEGTSMGLLAGDSVSLLSLVYGMMLKSGNDAANTAAVAVGGSIEGFCTLMNNRAKEIGMFNTSFENPSGLWSENHYSTAYDMALLGAQAIKNPAFSRICSAPEVRLEYGNPPYLRRLSNHNKLLTMYDGALGIKTGFTKKSGRCLVSAASRNGITLICVTLNAPDDWNDHVALLDYGFEVTKRHSAGDVQFVIPVTGGDLYEVSVCSASPLIFPSAFRFDSDNCNIDIYVEPFLYAPVSEGRLVGKATCYSDGVLVATTDLVTSQSVNSYENTDKNIIGFHSLIERFLNRIKDCFT